MTLVQPSRGKEVRRKTRSPHNDGGMNGIRFAQVRDFPEQQELARSSGQIILTAQRSPWRACARIFHFILLHTVPPNSDFPERLARRIVQRYLLIHKHIRFFIRHRGQKQIAGERYTSNIKQIPQVSNVFHVLSGTKGEVCTTNNQSTSV